MIIFILFEIFSVLLWGAVLSQIWDWFLKAPTQMSLDIWTAVGVVLVLKLLHMITKGGSPVVGSTRVIPLFAKSVAGPGMVAVVGFLIHLLLLPF